MSSHPTSPQNKLAEILLRIKHPSRYPAFRIGDEQNEKTRRGNSVSVGNHFFRSTLVKGQKRTAR
eukprot:5311041-Amphidinium_carterae.1